MWLKICGINNASHHRTDLLPIFKNVPQNVFEVELDIFFQVSQKSCSMPEWCGGPRAYHCICDRFSNISWFKNVVYLAILINLQWKHALLILEECPSKLGLPVKQMSSALLPSAYCLGLHCSLYILCGGVDLQPSLYFEGFYRCGTFFHLFLPFYTLSGVSRVWCLLWAL